MASTVLELLETSPSLIHTTDGEFSAAGLADDGRRLAASWRASGLGPGDRLAVFADNSVGYLRCIAAAAAGRLLLVSVNRRYSVAEARELVQRSGASLVVTDADPSVFRRFGPDRPGRPVVLDARSVMEPDAAESAAGRADGFGSRPDDPFIVFTTSGTTSRPKMVLHTQRSIADHARAVADHVGYGPDERVLVALPLCGVFGFNSLIAAVAGGSEIWMPDRFDAESVAGLVASERITRMNGSDDMFHRMLETSEDLATIRVGGYGRFNSSLDGIVERADAARVTLTGLYGMSEVQALFALRNPAEDVPGRERAGGSLTSPRADFRIADPEVSDPEVSALLPPGADGELLLAGPSLFAGYLAEGGEGIDSDLTASAHVEIDGRSWFRTGDLARAEDDGTFTYLTRMGDVLRLGGFLVNPAEIEAVVNELPGIEACAAVALARPGGVRAAVAVIADHDPDPATVIAHCADRLARFKVPVAVVRVPEFPTTPSANGTKIRVNELRDIVDDAVRVDSD